MERLNKLSNIKAIPYDKYFEPMELTDEQKRKRIELANQLEEFLIILFVLLRNNEQESGDSTVVRIEDKLSEMGQKITTTMHDEIYQIVTNIVDVTKRNLFKTKDDSENVSVDSKSYYTSDERAKILAEETSNSVFNSIEYHEAVSKGMTKKTWLTMRDDRVRGTHKSCEGQTIGINELFDVGSCKMRYPRDVENGTDEEIANCRCSLMYKK